LEIVGQRRRGVKWLEQYGRQPILRKDPHVLLFAVDELIQGPSVFRDTRRIGLANKANTNKKAPVNAGAF
jgi:hypothetical protein